jgi:hypothetical protein
MIARNTKICLLVDNAGSHAASENYTNVTLKFIPPKMTTHIQPMDAGIIRSLNASIEHIC